MRGKLNFLADSVVFAYIVQLNFHLVIFSLTLAMQPFPTLLCYGNALGLELSRREARCVVVALLLLLPLIELISQRSSACLGWLLASPFTAAYLLISASLIL